MSEQQSAESDARWHPFTCACGGEFRTTLAHVACPQCGSVTSVIPPASTTDTRRAE